MLAHSPALPAYDLFTEVFSGVEGGSISHEERAKKSLIGPEYTYGEIDMLHFLPLLKYATHKSGGVFWDLGCGTAKSLVVAATSGCKFAKICGVEFLHGLCMLAEKALHDFRASGKKRGLDKAICSKKLFRMVENDIRRVDWTDADVVFASSLCFPDELMKDIAEMGKKLKKGTIIISIKNWPDPTTYRVLHYLNVKMAWGKKGVYVLERL